MFLSVNIILKPWFHTYDITAEQLTTSALESDSPDLKPCSTICYICIWGHYLPSQWLSFLMGMVKVTMNRIARIMSLSDIYQIPHSITFTLHKPILLKILQNSFTISNNQAIYRELIDMTKLYSSILTILFYF